MGIAAFAASSRSAARSERSMYFPSAGSARSSAVNCRREDGRCLAAEPSRTAWTSAFSAFRTLFFSWCSAARRARSAAVPADSSEEADNSVSGSRLLICSTSPVARFSDTAPSRVIFCVILSVAFSSLIGSHLPFHRGRSHRRCHSRSWQYSEKWDMPGAGRPHFPMFSAAAPGHPCARSCVGFLPARRSRGYVRPSFREAHEPFHPIRVQRRCFGHRLFLGDDLRRQVPILLRRIEGRRLQGRAKTVRCHRGQIEYRRRQAEAPDCPVSVPLAEYPIVRQEHIQACRVPGGVVVGGKGCGKHQPRR